MRRMLSKEGEALYKRVEMRVFSADNRKSVKRIMVAPAGRGFTDADVEKILAKAANEIEQYCPTHDYGLVALGACRFNFVSRGLKECGAKL